MTYVQLLIAILGLVKEVLHYAVKLEEKKKDKINKILQFKDALKSARKNHDTSVIESAFLSATSNKLQNNKT